MLFAANLRRIVGKRDEGELGEALGLGTTPSAAASNLRKYLRGERWPGWEMLDKFAAVLDVQRSEFFDESA